MTFVAAWLMTHFVVGDLEKVVRAAAAELVLDVRGHGELSCRRDGASHAEPQTFSLVLHPVQEPEVPQEALLRVYQCTKQEAVLASQHRLNTVQASTFGIKT